MSSVSLPDAATRDPLLAEGMSWARGFAILAAAIGLLVLCGWTFGIDALKRVLPGLVTMKANTAAAFVLSGVSLYLHTLRSRSPAWNLVRRTSAALMLLLGLGTLAEYFFGWNGGIDQMLFSEPQGEILTSHPGRMSPITAVNFVLIGVALLLVEMRLWAAAQVAAAALMAPTMVSLTGYLFGNLSLTHPGNSTAIAAHTVVAFLIVGCGILAVTHGRGFLARLRGHLLAIGLLISLVMLAVIFAAAIYNAEQKSGASQWVEHTYETIHGMEVYSDSLHDYLYHSRGFLITGDSSHLDEKEKRRKAMSAEFDRIRGLLSDNPGQRERLDRLGGLAGQRMEQADRLEELRNQKGFQAAAALLSGGHADALIGEFDALLDEMRQTERTLLEERRLNAQAVNASSLFILNVALAASILLLLWVFRTSQREIAERRRATDSLRAGEEKLRLVLDSTAEAIYGIDLQGHCIFCNPACLHLLGYEHAGELIGKDMHWLIHYKHADGSPYPAEECPAYHTCVTGEARHVADDIFWRADGTGLPVEYRSHPQIVDGKVTGAVVSFLDLTERKLTEERLRISEERLALAVRTGNIGIWDWDVTNDILLWDDFMYSLYGLRRENFGGAYEAWLSALHPEDKAYTDGEIQAALRGEREYTPEFRVVWPDGSIHYIKAASHTLFDEKGKPVRMVGINYDLTERKLAEKELREKEERLALATIQNGVGVWDWNLVTQEMIWDDSMYALYHIRREDFIGTEEAWRKALHPDDLQRGDQEVNDAIAGIRPFNTEFRVVWPNGEIHHIKAVAKVFRDEQGTPVRMLGINMDITERKLAEEALRTSEERLHSIIQTSMDGIVQMDAGGIVTGWNNQMEKIFGWPGAEATGRALHETIIPPQHREAHVQGLKHFLLTGEGPVLNKRVEVIGMHRDGHVFPVELTITPIRMGWQYEFSAFLRDISERKQQENIQAARLRLMESAARLSVKELLVATLDEACALTGSAIGFYHFLEADQKTLSLQAWSTRTTREFCKALGEGLHYNIGEAGVWVDCVRERRPVIHNDYAALPHKRGMPPGHAPVVREMVVPIFRKELIVAILGIGNKATPYDDNDLESITRLADIAWDIAEAKRAEEEVLRLNAELEQRVAERTASLEAANKDMESFSYSISHDLRAPLRAINGFSNILQEDYAARLDDEGMRLLRVVSDNARKMGVLIDDILAFSRAGRNEIVRSTIDMNSMVAGVWEDLKPEMAGRDVHLEMGDLPPIEGDPAMMHQVVFNLLSNAVKFTKHRADARIEARGQAGEHETVYYVKDNGAGFDMQYADKLFGVFQRLHGMDEFEGTGIGLAIVKRIVTKHGGRVWAEGKPGEGATIWFALPDR